METCNVCVGKFTSRATKITCESCEFSSCSKCVARYIRENNIEAKCMNCKELWSREFIQSSMSNAETKRMLEHRASVELKKQVSMLPSTQPFIILDDSIKKRVADIKERERKLRAELQSLNASRVQIEREYEQAVMQYINPNAAKGKEKVLLKSQQVGHCTQDNCRGFIDGATYKCALCDTPHCRRCMEHKEEEHVCDESAVASIRMMRESSKPCPTCHVPIHKINGCNDMFCVQCKTAFCWRTLEVHKNGNSNPHYIRWLHDGNNIRGARGEVAVFMSSEVFRRQSREHRNFIGEVLQTIGHNDRVLRDKINPLVGVQGARKMLDHRIQFLKSLINESWFKRVVKKHFSDLDFIGMLQRAHEKSLQLKDYILTSEVKIGFDNGINEVIATIDERINEINADNVHVCNFLGRKKISALRTYRNYAQNKFLAS